MAAEPRSGLDPAVDLAIKQLLDQQADIQAKLAALLPEKYGPNVKLELDMLRHKLRVLRAYSEQHRKWTAMIELPAFQLTPGTLSRYLD
jgi:hypothetical protein